jgi:DNA-binding NarL/FixJ family response regulator
MALHDAAARELRRVGAHVPTGARRSTTGGDPLTEREREIAELVAGGATNKQVAVALFVSDKTVERHLSNVYAKLGVRSRTELAAMLARG